MDMNLWQEEWGIILNLPIIRSIKSLIALYRDVRWLIKEK
jgi:hypothetical protein